MAFRADGVFPRSTSHVQLAGRGTKISISGLQMKEEEEDLARPRTSSGGMRSWPLIVVVRLNGACGCTVDQVQGRSSESVR